MPIKNKYNSGMEDLTEACKDYKLHLTIFLCVIISEYIGVIALEIAGVNIVLMPLLYALVLAIAFYITKPFEWIEKTQSEESSAIMMLLVGPLLVKLAILKLSPILISKSSLKIPFELNNSSKFSSVSI